jgi:D-ribose pyranase
MLKTGILNPRLLNLAALFRHTNTLVIADRGFPSWKGIETVDISLVDGVPTVLQVFEALRGACVVGRIYMAKEFEQANKPNVRKALAAACGSIPIVQEPHAQLKARVPHAIGVIRTGDTIHYSNMILESA